MFKNFLWGPAFVIFTLKEETFAKETFAISQFFAKTAKVGPLKNIQFTKVYFCKIF